MSAKKKDLAQMTRANALFLHQTTTYE